VVIERYFYLQFGGLFSGRGGIFNRIVGKFIVVKKKRCQEKKIPLVVNVIFERRKKKTFDKGQLDIW